ncbi:carotenoid oxygenase family protein [Pseudonocardia spinosispora]|uniref:carotenoid oxygenase family protein n=1 Tax=Pseudonocardia spinosispora TaxID=103441 RepID=UPI00041EABFC|nr:carotenoid oxygenase family protein [Pseudonocardia spinosispora]
MPNKFLEDAFAPVREELTLTDLQVSGTIPDYLDGRFLRNGPNPVAEVDPETYNWFMGNGMVHGVRLRDGRAEWYRNRWIRSPEAAKALGETIPTARRPAPFPEPGANTSVIQHAGRTLALIEGGAVNYELTDELDTVGYCDFDGTLPGGYTAHPHRDPATGELHAVSYFIGRGNTVQYSVIGADGRARRTVDIEVAGSPMMHDLALTEKYVVFYDLPVTFDAREAVQVAVPRPLRTPARLVLSALIGRVRIPDPMTALLGRGFPANGPYPYSWNPDYRARVGVMPRDGASADVRWFDVDPCYVFHTMNAYDEGDTIVLDVVRHPEMIPADHAGQDRPQLPTLDRWTIDLTAGKVRESRTDDHPQEFPRIDERLAGRRHRYGYGIIAGFGFGTETSGALLKHDLVAGGTLSRRFGRQHSLSEFVFVPDSTRTGEDHGVLMGLVSDLSTNTADLTIVDAQTLDTVATIHIPARVPQGIHGHWAPTAG